jgi:hypothetical protein
MRLRGTAHQVQIAAAIHQGVRAYFYSDPPVGSRISQLAAAGAARPMPASSGGADSGG